MICQRIAFVAAVLGGSALLSSCGGGGASSTSPLPNSGGGTHPQATITLKIVIPPKTQSLLFHRLPQWVSPGTTKVTISINSGAPVSTPVSCPPCTAQITVNAPANQLDTFTIRAEDSSSTVLSDATVSETPPPGASSFNVTLGGYASEVALLSICPTATPNCGAIQQTGVAGVSSQWTVTLAKVLDPDGYSIAGPLDTPMPVSITEADNSNTLSLSKSSFTSVGDTVTLTYNGGFDGENSPSGAIGVNVHGTNPQYGTGTLYALFMTTCPAGTITCSDFGYFGNSGAGNSFDGTLAAFNGDVWYGNNDSLGFLASNGARTEYPTGGPNATTGPPVSITPNNGFFGLIAVGTNLYFSEANNPIVGDFNPAGLPNAFSEFNSGSFSSTVNSPTIGSDGNIYFSEGQNNGPMFAEINSSTNAYTEYVGLCTGNPVFFVAAFGTSIFFVAQDQNVTGKYELGSFTLPQNPNTCIPKAKEQHFWPTPNPADPDVIGGIAIDPVHNLIWATGTRQATGVSDIFSSSTAFAFNTYTLPASWNGGSSTSLGGIAFDPNDQNVYFDDLQNGIIGRIPSGSPSTANITGYGTKYKEPSQSGAPNFLDPVVVGSDQNIYFAQTAIIVNDSSLPFSGTGILNPSLASWVNNPVSGLAKYRAPQQLHKRRPAARYRR